MLMEAIGQSVDKGLEGLTSTDVTNLNNDQQRASGKNPPQLLMMVPGEGGIGKLKLIQTMTCALEQKEVGDWCVKGAYTGIAASLIDGKTLHVLAGIPVHGGKRSAQTLKKLQEFWCGKQYFIIDEVSMLSQAFFAKLSRIISLAMEEEVDKVFGELNVIIVGDFHQFPPVVAHHSASLYCLANPQYDSEDKVLGHKIYEQFTTVVQLKEQIRIKYGMTSYNMFTIEIVISSISISSNN
jgi:PIF1-like helicase